MKTEKWYDVKCEICRRYLSTDFGYGMQPTRELALKYAKEVGYKTKNNKNVCPHCYPTEKGGEG